MKRGVFMETGKRIKYFREKKGYTVNKLANKSGISQSYLRDIELGSKNPTVEYLSYICDALEITLSAFFDDEQTDELTKEIKKLTSDQKEKLTEFLKTFKK